MNDWEHGAGADEPETESERPLDFLATALGQPPQPARSLLPKIQERINQRTKGRYYRRRRATLRDPVTLLLAVVVLVLILAAASYLVFSGLVGAL